MQTSSSAPASIWTPQPATPDPLWLAFCSARQVLIGAGLDWAKAGANPVDFNTEIQGAINALGQLRSLQVSLS